MTAPNGPVGRGDHVVAAGDSVISIAVRAGHLPDTIWNDSANAALKDARSDGEVLLPGDRVAVMDIRPKAESRATGKRHVFQRNGLTVKVTLCLQDEEGEPFAGKKYELVIDGKAFDGTTDDEGRIACTIDPLARDGTLSVWLAEPGLPNPWVRQVSLATLYPVEHPIGVQQRLANLGFYTAEVDGEIGPVTAAAIVAFRTSQGLEPKETIDDELRTKLVEVHQV